MNTPLPPPPHPPSAFHADPARPTPHQYGSLSNARVCAPATNSAVGFPAPTSCALADAFFLVSDWLPGGNAASFVGNVAEGVPPVAAAFVDAGAAGARISRTAATTSRSLETYDGGAGDEGLGVGGIGGRAGRGEKPCLPLTLDYSYHSYRYWYIINDDNGGGDDGRSFPIL